MRVYSWLGNLPLIFITIDHDYIKNKTYNKATLSNYYIQK